MIFNSFEFALFFIVFLVVFFAAPQRFRGIVILVASYIFYGAWKPVYCLLLFFTTVVDYTSGRALGATTNKVLRRLTLTVALTINIGLLCFLKYFDFAITSLTGFEGLFTTVGHPVLMNLVLPVGISFYTFQSVAYTIDVFLEQLAPEKSFLTYASYVSFFPQLVAGPIERGGHMLPQFKKRHFLRAENFSFGLWLIGWGLFKKMCVADVISTYVDAIYGAPQNFGGLYNLLATLLFAVQVYADFSGYSTIARGVAKMFDYDLMVNFRQPYFSTSVTEFWHRWHISLSTWFRDYVYVPLGGSRVSEARQLRNVMAVFILSGLWHGAAWAFVMWGAMHGLALVLERTVRRHVTVPDRVRASRGWAVAGWTWTAVVVVAGWVFFRARSWSGAMAVFSSFAHPGTLSYDTFKVAEFPVFSIVSAALSLLVLFVGDYVIYYRQRQLYTLRDRPLISALGAVALFYTIVFFGVFGHASFIYFQF